MKKYAVYGFNGNRLGDIEATDIFQAIITAQMLFGVNTVWKVEVQ